jgi:hypothetical protein
VPIACNDSRTRRYLQGVRDCLCKVVIMEFDVLWRAGVCLCVRVCACVSRTLPWFIYYVSCPLLVRC